MPLTIIDLTFESSGAMCHSDVEGGFLEEGSRGFAFTCQQTFENNKLNSLHNKQQFGR